MKSKKLQRAIKYKQLVQELLNLQSKVADELKVYLSYPEGQMFSVEWIYGILCGVSEELSVVTELALDNTLSLVEDLKNQDYS